MSGTPLDFAARPPSEVEWEDLLVRLEIVPRAVRLAVEDAGDSPELRAALHRVIGVEIWVEETLRALREGRPVNLNVAQPQLSGAADSAALAQGFASMREQNFAQVQRRGLGVWDWKSDVPGEKDSMTAYQLLQWLARTDGERLATLRAAGRGNR